MADDVVFIPPNSAGQLVDGRPAQIGLVAISQEMQLRIIEDDPTVQAEFYAQVRAAILAMVPT